MKKIGLTLAAAGMAFGMCGMGFAQDTKSADKSFIKDASEGSLAEINYAKLAIEKSKDPNVLKFAHQMITHGSCEVPGVEDEVGYGLRSRVCCGDG
jgi:predicted outer membrane protein